MVEDQTKPVAFSFGRPAPGLESWTPRGPVPDRRRHRQACPANTGSGSRRTPNAASTPAAISRASATSWSVVPAPRLVSASVCLPEIATVAGSPCPRAKPARSISHAADVLTVPSACGKRGGRASGPSRSRARASSAAKAARGEHGVGEERAGRDGVGVGRVDDHALAAAQREHGLADLRERRGVPDGDAERAGQLRVADRARGRRAREVERDLQHDPAPRRALEAARAVREPALRGRELDQGARRAVVGADRGDRLGDLLAVGPDVLDRRRADRARDPGQALDPGAARGDAAGDERVPRLAGGDGQAVALRAHPARGDAQHRAGEARVGDHEVRAARDDQQRRARLVGRAHGGDDGRLVGRLHEAAGRPAKAQRGQLGEHGGHPAQRTRAVSRGDRHPSE